MKTMKTRRSGSTRRKGRMMSSREVGIGRGDATRALLLRGVVHVTVRIGQQEGKDIE